MKRIFNQIKKRLELLMYILLMIIAAYLILESFGVTLGAEGQGMISRLAKLIMGLAWLTVCAMANEGCLER